VTTHRFHGDERRFEVTADFVAARFPQARTAADVAGGQGMLARILRKRHNVQCDSNTAKLGRDELLAAIEKHQAAYGASERVILDFNGPHNRALVLLPGFTGVA
jgi:hypothetical protein